MVTLKSLKAQSIDAKSCIAHFLAKTLKPHNLWANGAYCPLPFFSKLEVHLFSKPHLQSVPSLSLWDPSSSLRFQLKPEHWNGSWPQVTNTPLMNFQYSKKSQWGCWNCWSFSCEPNYSSRLSSTVFFSP